MKAANEKLAKNGGSNPNRILREGDSQNVIYAVPSLGIDPSSGEEIFLKKNGEVTKLWDSADRVNCGISEPKYRGNLSTMVRYKDLTFNMSFGYRWGGQLYNQTLITAWKMLINAIMWTNGCSMIVGKSRGIRPSLRE